MINWTTLVLIFTNSLLFLLYMEKRKENKYNVKRAAIIEDESDLWRNKYYRLLKQRKDE